MNRVLLAVFVGLAWIGLSTSSLHAQSTSGTTPPSSPSSPPSKTSDKIELYFFYAEDCQPCHVILQGYLPSLKAMFPTLEVKSFDAGQPSYYEALSRLEEKLGRRGSELPVILIGNQVLSGEMEIMERLNPLILEYQVTGAIPLPPVDIPSRIEASEKDFTVDLVYFYQKGCPKCARADHLLNYLSKKYPNLNIKGIDLNTSDGKRLNETLSSRLHLPPEKRLIAPSIFIGTDYVLPEEITESRIEALIKKYQRTSDRVSDSDKRLSGASPSPSVSPSLSVTPDELKKAEESMVSRFKSLGVLTIISAGLIDGINPCAFATLIFFVSYLTLVGRKRREVFWVGMGFSGAVFATYLLIGLGILRFVQHLSFLPVFSRVVYFLTMSFALFLGLLSLYDYVQLRRGRPAEMKLQLPQFLKKRIHQTIRETSQSPRYFFAAVMAGFIVSLLEFTCTGQVYLPTILFVTNIPSLKVSAFSYLILYNVMFIIPLLTIFGVVHWGVTSEELAFFLKKRTAAIKLITALLFFGLAAILIVNYL